MYIAADTVTHSAFLSYASGDPSGDSSFKSLEVLPGAGFTSICLLEDGSEGARSYTPFCCRPPRRTDRAAKRAALTDMEGRDPEIIKDLRFTSL